MISKKSKSLITLSLSVLLGLGLFSNMKAFAQDKPRLNIGETEDRLGVQFDWVDSTGNKLYRIYSKNDLESSFKTIPILDKIKVLNIYPDKADPVDGEDPPIETNEPATLKKWMEDDGYGQGNITVDEIKLTDFNTNPENYDLIEYDVVMFGTWNNNNGQDLSADALPFVKDYIDKGYGVLLGHDTISYGTGELASHSTNFNELAEYIKLTGTSYVSYEDPKRGSGDIARVSKIGALTKFPYNMGELNSGFDITYSTTASQRVAGDIWVDFFNSEASEGNFYVTTFNNVGMTQVGHLNESTKENDLKLLANTLMYLGQATKENRGVTHDLVDLAAPPKPTLQRAYFSNGDIKFVLENKEDLGTNYQVYVEALNLDTQEITKSDAKNINVRSGIKEYEYSVNNIVEAIPENGESSTSSSFTKSISDLDLSEPVYLHVRAIDLFGNTSEVLSSESITLKPSCPVLNRYDYSEGNLKIDIKDDTTLYELQGGILTTPRVKYKVELFKNYSPYMSYEGTTLRTCEGLSPGDTVTGEISAIDAYGNLSNPVQIEYQVGQSNNLLKAQVASYLSDLVIRSTDTSDSLKQQILSLDTSNSLTVDEINIIQSTKYTEGNCSIKYTIDGEPISVTKAVQCNPRNQTKDEYIQDVKKYVDQGEVRQYISSNQQNNITRIIKDEIESSCKDNSSLGEIEIEIDEEHSEGNALKIDVYYKNS